MKRYVLIAGLMLLHLAPHAAAQTTEVEGRPLVVFIHGRDQAWQTADELEARWFGAFADGLEKLAPDAQSENRYRALVPPEDRLLVRYERVYEPGFVPSAQCGGVPADPIGTLAARQYEMDVAVEDMRQIAVASGMTEQQRFAMGQLDTAAGQFAKAVSAGYSSQAIEKAGALSRILHAMRNAAGNVLGAGAATMFLEDTKLYLRKGPHHCETNVRLQVALDQAASQNRPVIIVAHSMGAMVTLDQLWRSGGANYNIARFVSLGSQLGMPDLLRYLAGAGADRPLLPRTINDWVNIKGENDLLGYTVAPGTVSFVRGGPASNVIRHTGAISSAHGISRYLQLRDTAHAIADAYCSSFVSGRRPAQCDVIRPFAAVRAGN